MSENLKQLHAKLDHFYSEGYLQTWCSNVRQEWTEFLDRAFNIIIPNLLPNALNPTVVDVGCGPSISNVISASKWSQHIYLADYLDSNRKQVENFWKQNEGAFNWDHYFRFVGVLELNPDPLEIEQRTRNAIKGVYFCDVTAAEMLHVQVQADVIIASLVLDVVAITDKMFASCLSNVLKYLKPNGIILIQGSLHESQYTVGSAVFPVMNITQDRLLDIFKACNLQVHKLELCCKVSTHYFCILQKREL